MSVYPRRAVLLAASLIASFACLRLYLFLSPSTNLDIGAYNIHHLFTGLLLIVICGIPLVVSARHTRVLDLATVGFGTGLGMALDEWLYLIVTDGSDSAYLLPVSFWGGVALVGGAALYTLVLAGLCGKNKTCRAKTILKDAGNG